MFPIEIVHGFLDTLSYFASRMTSATIWTLECLLILHLFCLLAIPQTFFPLPLCFLPCAGRWKNKKQKKSRFSYFSPTTFLTFCLVFLDHSVDTSSRLSLFFFLFLFFLFFYSLGLLSFFLMVSFIFFFFFGFSLFFNVFFSFFSQIFPFSILLS